MKKETISKVTITVSFVDFVLFLEGRSALNQYIHSISGRKISDITNSIYPENWISGIFIWDRTSEGRDFWEKLDKEWISLLRKDVSADAHIEYVTAWI